MAKSPAPAPAPQPTPAPTAAPAPAPTSAPAPAAVEAALLRDCGFGAAGDVVSLTPADAEQAVLHGMADTNPAAIAAAKA